MEVDHEDDVEQENDEAELEAALKASAESSAVVTPDGDISMMHFEDTEHDRQPRIGEETEVEHEFGGSSSRARGTGSRRSRQHERWVDVHAPLPVRPRPESYGSAEDMAGIAEDMVNVLSSGSDPEDIPRSRRASRRGGVIIKDN